jgi:hypothetical protein
MARQLKCCMDVRKPCWYRLSILKQRHIGDELRIIFIKNRPDSEPCGLQYAIRRCVIPSQTQSTTVHVHFFYVGLIRKWICAPTTATTMQVGIFKMLLHR